MVLKLCGFPHGPLSEEEKNARLETLQGKSKKDLMALAGRPTKLNMRHVPVLCLFLLSYWSLYLQAPCKCLCCFLVANSSVSYEMQPIPESRTKEQMAG